MGKISWEVIGSIVGAPIGLLCLLYIVWGYRKKTLVKDKVVLITGATSGLGKACAKIFLQAGCHVILAGRSVDKLKETSDILRTELGKRQLHDPKLLVMDLEDVSSLPSKVKDALRFHGRVDILVNNAGISYRGQIEDTAMEVDRKVMMVNYFGQIAITKALLPIMLSQGGGYIVGISSVQGKFSIPYRSAYSASKHAFQAFFDCLRAEVADRNVKVSIISPGYMHTNLSQNAVCSDGSKHGVTDPTTASGMSPEYVAQRVLQAIEFNQADVILATLMPKLAYYTRVLFPKTYFSLMRSRARKQKIDYLKNK
ncbi:dehydrogenase/reductase SDR family member 7B-like [Haliotis rufescens]|uniref:dehydrogenase/reductase SDR family member 7B-like n=1 Tax=Haliotis rufescens TaxID=6454 RepID=UPI00201F2021|nr:dehydrogenase/reductase SDR family member 7B-like [Haliotis rufescens]XP_046369943.2 dehydrogenase/reductase SDR family member 7B-like [Haliotis rufescens]